MHSTMSRICRYFLLTCVFIFLFTTSAYSAGNGQSSESDFERKLRRIRDPLSDVPHLAFKQELQAIRNRIEYEDRRNREKAAQEEEHNLLRILTIIPISLFVGIFLSIWSIKKFFMTTKPVLKEYDADEVIDAEFVENDDRKGESN